MFGCPVPRAPIVSTTTHKSLRGPRDPHGLARRHQRSGPRPAGVNPRPGSPLPARAAQFGGDGDVFTFCEPYGRWCGVVRRRSGRNAMAEVLNGTFKAELIEMQGPWRDVGQVERTIFQWITWYNEERLDSALGYVPPTEYPSLSK
ncbi:MULTISPECIES: integrase core domain-containing protein [unclassified Streptomyces]|uniref:integrase core domain-containing protein n=1 Tax=unclassified Streptomyces TaxID=2593676 RepID=UPI002B1CE258|nr:MULTISPECIES: integrase core domain-containing protein [unclassified Streptomyces]